MITIIEVLLILGLLGVLLVVAFLHFITTTSLPWVIEITGVDPSPEHGPWFLVTEAILFLSAFDIFINVIS